MESVRSSMSKQPALSYGTLQPFMLGRIPCCANVPRAGRRVVLDTSIGMIGKADSDVGAESPPWPVRQDGVLPWSMIHGQ